MHASCLLSNILVTGGSLTGSHVDVAVYILILAALLTCLGSIACVNSASHFVSILVSFAEES